MRPLFFVSRRGGAVADACLRPHPRRRRASSAGDRTVPEPGLLIVPAGQRQSGRLGGARRCAGAQFRRRLLGRARLEGHFRQARVHRPSMGVRPRARPRRGLYAADDRQWPGRRHRGRCGRTLGVGQARGPRRRRSGTVDRGRRRAHRPRHSAGRRGGRLARPLRSERSAMSRCGAARTRAAFCRMSTSSSISSASAPGAATPHASICPAKAIPDCATPSLVQAAGTGPILAAVKENAE